MEVVGILIVIVIIAVILFGLLNYVVDLFLKKKFKPKEEYLVEINNLKFISVKPIIESLIVMVILAVKSRTIIILALPVFIVFEIIYFLYKLKYLQSKDESKNTIKYFILKTLFWICTIALTVTYFFCEILD